MSQIFYRLVLTAHMRLTCLELKHEIDSSGINSSRFSFGYCMCIWSLLKVTSLGAGGDDAPCRHFGVFIRV